MRSTALGCLLGGLLRRLPWRGLLRGSLLRGCLLDGLLGRSRLLRRGRLLRNRSRRSDADLWWFLDAEHDVLVDLQRCDTSFRSRWDLHRSTGLGVTPHAGLGLPFAEL